MVAWQRSPIYEKDGSQENPPKSELDYLLEFLRQEVEREEQRVLARSGFSDHTKLKQVFKKKESSVPTAAGLHFWRNKTGMYILWETTSIAGLLHSKRMVAGTEMEPHQRKRGLL